MAFVGSDCNSTGRMRERREKQEAKNTQYDNAGLLEEKENGMKKVIVKFHRIGNGRWVTMEIIQAPFATTSERVLFSIGNFKLKASTGCPKVDGSGIRVGSLDNDVAYYCSPDRKSAESLISECEELIDAFNAHLDKTDDAVACECCRNEKGKFCSSCGNDLRDKED